MNCTGRFSSTGAIAKMRGAVTVDPLSNPVLLRAGDVAELFVCVPAAAFGPGQAKRTGQTKFAYKSITLAYCSFSGRYFGKEDNLLAGHDKKAELFYVQKYWP